jgi:carbon-monoxide dehydrogenase large subunit
MRAIIRLRIEDRPCSPAPGAMSATSWRRCAACGLHASTHPRALIAAVDAAAARALPGVLAVLVLDDLAPAMAKRRMVRTSNSGTPLDRCWAFALADGEVSYVGEPVALVLATNRYIAEDAAALVDVTYDILPAAVDCRDAARAGAPAVRREIATNVVSTSGSAMAMPTPPSRRPPRFAKASSSRGGAHSIEGRLWSNTAAG